MQEAEKHQWYFRNVLFQNFFLKHPYPPASITNRPVTNITRSEIPDAGNFTQKKELPSKTFFIGKKVFIYNV